MIAGARLQAASSRRPPTGALPRSPRATLSGPRPPASTTRPSTARARSRCVGSSLAPRAGRAPSRPASPSRSSTRVAAADLALLALVDLDEVGLGFVRPRRRRPRPTASCPERAARASAARGLAGSRMNPHRSAPASTATATSSSRVSPQTFTSGRESSSRSFAGRVGGPHQRGADEDRVGAGELGRGALRARVDGALGDRRPGRAAPRATSSSCAARSIAKVDEVARVDPDHGRAPSATARPSSAASCASTSVSSPSRAACAISAAAARSSRSRRISSAASAPALASSSRCSLGREEALGEERQRPSRRARHAGRRPIPPKRSSTSTETAAAPARANAGASGAGSASGRRSPADGERRLISAIAGETRAGERVAEPTHRREGDERLEPLGRGSRVDRLAGELEPVAEIVRVPAGGDRAGGVEQDRVALARPAPRPRRPPGSRRRSRPASRRAAPRARSGRCRGRAGRSRARAPSPSTTSQTRFGPAGESSSTPNAPWTTNARRAPSRASTSAIVRHERRVVDADDLGARAGRVRERPEDVEDRPRRELLAHGRGVPESPGGARART